MTRFTEFLGGQRRVWIDYAAYAGRLLGNGAAPWADVAELVSWYRKAQGLLGSDVVTLPVARIAQAWLAANPGLQQALTEKKRATAPLKALLADESLRGHLHETIAGLHDSFAATPLVLACPAPGAFVRAAHAWAHGETGIEIGEDEIDDGAVYLADFLRAFGDTAISALLLEEDAVPAAGVLDEFYRPLFNLATHYRWDAGLLLPGGPVPEGVDGLGYVVAPADAAGAVRDMPAGYRLTEDFWQDGEVPAGALLLYLEVPETAQPERVLERLQEVKS